MPLCHKMLISFSRTALAKERLCLQNVDSFQQDLHPPKSTKKYETAKRQCGTNFRQIDFFPPPPSPPSPPSPGLLCQLLIAVSLAGPPLTALDRSAPRRTSSASRSGPRRTSTGESLSAVGLARPQPARFCAPWASPDFNRTSTKPYTMPDRMPEDMPDRMSEDMPDRKRRYAR